MELEDIERELFSPLLENLVLPKADVQATYDYLVRGTSAEYLLERDSNDEASISNWIMPSLQDKSFELSIDPNFLIEDEQFSFWMLQQQQQ